MTLLSTNLDLIRRRMAAAAGAMGRDVAAIRLIAVSKGQSTDDVKEALKAGQRCFGENRVQEAEAKFGPLRALYSDLELHLVGPLQTNKAEAAVQLFDVIETLDRPKLAQELAKAITKTGRTPRLSIEINSGNEPQKAGIAPAALGDFLAFCNQGCGLSVTGLMCIPPHTTDPEPYFRELKTLADQHGLSHISMGMSADFETAIRCGATEVRVGTALFGARHT